ncbi:TPA: hypothetical protein HA243_02995 [Candidatus Micrarchaeota archaeon]|nr:hypothetical protein [Candidatus Micrarchaeota archaeon]
MAGMKILTKNTVKKYGLDEIAPKFRLFKIVSRRKFESLKVLAEETKIEKFDSAWCLKNLYENIDKAGKDENQRMDSLYDRLRKKHQPYLSPFINADGCIDYTEGAFTNELLVYARGVKRKGDRLAPPVVEEAEEQVKAEIELGNKKEALALIEAFNLSKELLKEGDGAVVKRE